MNTISSLGTPLTMDGLNAQKITASYAKNKPSSESTTEKILISPNGSEVAQNIEKKVQDIEADAQQLQRMSDMVMGRKLQFNVNDELGSVVVKIIDPNTDQIIKEIPSEDIQKLKINIRKAIGIIFDEIA